MYENFAAAFFAALPFLCVIFIQRGVCGRQAGREGGNWRVARGKADLLHIILALVLYKPTAAHVPLASVVRLMLARGGSRARYWGWGMAEELQRQMELELVTCAQQEIS